MTDQQHSAATGHGLVPCAVPSDHVGPRSLGRLLEAVISLGTEPDLAAVLRRIVEAAVDLTDAQYGALGVLDDSRTELAEFITVGVDDETRAGIGAPPKGLGLLGALITNARPLRVADVREYSGRSGFPANHPPMTSFLGVPILVREQAFGNLYLTDKRDGDVFTDIDEELMVGLASAAGVAIDNARLVDQLKRREAALSAVQEIADAVLGGADPAATLRFVAERARVLARADIATFALPAPDGETLVMEVEDGDLGGDVTGTRFPRRGSVSGDVLQSHETAVFSDLSKDLRREQPQVARGLVGPAIFVALTGSGQPIGTLFVGRAIGAPEFSGPDVGMVRSFAAQAGVVLEHSTQRDQLSKLSVLEEQERIARDLHDTVIQQVFAVGLTLQGALAMSPDQALRARISTAVDDLDTVIRQVRTVIFDVETSANDSTPGLRSDLLELVRDASRALGFEPTLIFDGPVDTVVDDETGKAAMATVREALSNVARHAQATKAEVSITVKHQRLTVEVSDNGIGLPEGEDRQGGGRGLRNMRTRAENAGGELELHSRPERDGTVLEWVVPLS